MIKVKLYIFLLLIAMLAPIVADAQRVRWVSSPAIAGCFRQAVDTLPQIPTYRSDMSLRVRQAYAAMDSILRSQPALDSMYSAMSTFRPDTILRLAKYYYDVVDYDALMYKLFVEDGSAQNHSYIESPRDLQRLYLEYVATLSPELASIHLGCLSEAEAILKIHVDAVFDDWDTLSRTPIKCVIATILDTIKGQHLLTGRRDWRDQNLVYGPPSAIAPHINILYAPEWPQVLPSTLPHDAPFGSHNVDEHAPKLGPDLFEVGRDYVTFLRFSRNIFDGRYHYLDVSPANGSDKHGGVFPFVDNRIIDKENYWGAGENASEAEFVEAIRKQIAWIRSY